MSEKLQMSTYWNGLLNSYGQVFFAKDKRLAYVLLIVSFFDLGSGFGGILAALTAQAIATLFGYHKSLIEDGSLSFNALMVGLGIGISFEWNYSILALIPIAGALTFLLSAWFMNSLGTKKLPFLSLPFLFGIWILLLGAGNFSLAKLMAKSSLSLYAFFPEIFIQTSAWVDTWAGGDYWHLLFRSVGAIFFQFNDLAGMLILVALLFHSRISFLLSLFGFSIGYLFYAGLEGDFSQLIYAYIGFNFILTGIALGGFFIIANWRSFILVAAVIPLAAMLISALHDPLGDLGLPLYSLPFNILVLLVLMALGLRYKNTGLIPVLVQRFSAERNLYHHLQYQERFGSKPAYNISLPILGEWYVSQDHDGQITHLDEYRYAWDFDVRDKESFTFRAPGATVEDFYCYNMPVCAPAEGTVVAVQDHIPDNEIGEVNLQQNWGNSIVIYHAEGLYSQLSHLKPGSIQLSVGDYVERGQVIAKCGSSGRSPEPHLHFQLQWIGKIGAPTLKYPLGTYLTLSDDKQFVHQYTYPKTGDTVQNFKKLDLLTKSFQFLPGQQFHAQLKGTDKKETWKVYTDALNHTYLHCEKNGALAYFLHDGFRFRFSEFHGDRKSLLYQFYLGAYHILLGNYPDQLNEDQLDPTHLSPSLLLWTQDFLAPFVRLLRVFYRQQLIKVNDPHSPSKAILKSTIEVAWLNKTLKKREYQLEVSQEEKGERKIKLWENEECICISHLP